MLKRSLFIFASMIMICLAVFSRAIQPAIEFTKWPVYNSHGTLNYRLPVFDASKKTVVIIADKDGTEMFDMLAPFYLFSATGKANVFIIAENMEPVVVKKGLFVLPQYTFRQIDSLGIPIDVIVIPNQSNLNGMTQKKPTVNFIRNHYTGNNTILAVCDGSATAAATGLYDGKLMTTHSSDFEMVKKMYNKPSWVQGVTVTQSGNLFSTAGVSNATEGSLTVIKELFGDETMQQVMKDIHYPADEIKKEHKNLTVTKDAIFIAVKKGAFKSNERVGVLLSDGINELYLAGILDSYYRSFPASIETFSMESKPIVSKYGLTFLPTGDILTNTCTELHIPGSLPIAKEVETLFARAKFIRYQTDTKQYIIDICLQRIEEMYGYNFATTVKLMLDYN